MYSEDEEARMQLEMKNPNGRGDWTNLLYLSRLLEILVHQRLLRFRKNMELLKVNYLVCLNYFVLDWFQFKMNQFSDQTACCYMFVEGNPAPTFKFYKVMIPLIFKFNHKNVHFSEHIYLLKGYIAEDVSWIYLNKIFYFHRR